MKINSKCSAWMMVVPLSKLSQEELLVGGVEKWDDAFSLECVEMPTSPVVEDA